MQFAKQLAKNGETNLSSIVNANKPVLQDNNVLFSLPTRLMEEQFMSTKSQLIKFLRIALNNYSFVIKTKVESAEKKKYVYSPQEKFQKLAELNPAVLNLKKTFGLDI